MRVLIVKMSSLGDILQAFAVLPSIEGTIDWVVEEKFASLVKDHPKIHKTIAINSRKPTFKELRAEKYDVLYDLQGNCKSGLFTLMARAKRKVGFTLSQAPEWPNALATREHISVDLTAPMREQYLTLVGGKLERLPSTKSMSKMIMICFGSNWASKRLSLELWIDFLSRIEGYEWLFIWKSDEERAFATKLQERLGGQMRGDLDFPAWRALMRECRAVVSVDSCALHLASEEGIDTFGIFGPSLARAYAPHAAIQGSCPYGKSFNKRCPILRTCAAPCMNHDPEALAHQLKQVIEVHV
ncbi:MAG: glycosyltransferase family 9 protein [Simkaniaceae bacterium]|nr:glycosyltransferase family 9 protein [Simkaniaceae bacterium]